MQNLHISLIGQRSLLIRLKIIPENKNIGIKPVKDLTQSNRAHKSTRGIRVRLRTALITAGITQKFRTDEARNLTLVVISSEFLQLPFDTFEGRSVRFLHRN